MPTIHEMTDPSFGASLSEGDREFLGTLSSMLQARYGKSMDGVHGRQFEDELFRLLNIGQRQDHQFDGAMEEFIVGAIEAVDAKIGKLGVERSRLEVALREIRARSC